MQEVIQNLSESGSNPTTKKRRLFKGKKWPVFLLILLLLLAVGFIMLRRMGNRPNTMEISYQQSAAEIRTITRSLSGSGTLQPANSYTVTTLVSGEILSDTFEEGDVVGEDELLYVIDSSDASSTQTQAQKNYEQAVKNKYPTSDMTGIVSEVFVQDGDMVSSGTKLCTIWGITPSAPISSSPTRATPPFMSDSLPPFF